MSLLTTIVNQTIWDLYRNMDFFEYEYDVTIEMDTPKSDETCLYWNSLWCVAFGALLDSIWDNEEIDTTVNTAITPTSSETKRAVSSNEMKKAYDAMAKAQKDIQNEYVRLLSITQRIIPTLERNAALLKAKGTEKWPLSGRLKSRSRITLEKIEDMLDRCQITTKRCTRLLHMGKERYGNRDDDPFLVSLILPWWKERLDMGTNKR